jgi:hypothetical protein
MLRTCTSMVHACGDARARAANALGSAYRGKGMNE